MRLLTVAAVVLTLLPLPSCGCNESEGTPKVRKVSARVKDRKAYNLGEQHAQSLLENAGDEGYVQDGLLDVRARMSNIESNLGRQSAVDYERGFTDYIKKNCDSLARIIF